MSAMFLGEDRGDDPAVSAAPDDREHVAISACFAYEQLKLIAM